MDCNNLSKIKANINMMRQLKERVERYLIFSQGTWTKLISNEDSKVKTFIWSFMKIFTLESTMKKTIWKYNNNVDKMLSNQMYSLDLTTYLIYGI